MTDPDLETMLDELRTRGVTVTRGEPAAAEEVRSAEETLGFTLPDELVQFYRTWGELQLQRGVRTLVFYGLAAALARTARFRDAFAFACDDFAADDDPEADPQDLCYFPRRFVVVHDAGSQSSEAGWGTVYDDEREGLLVTDTKGVSRSAVHDLDDGYLLDELSRFRDELASE